jgi:23S rRNA (cytosine1962-C5)-methyltransferase
LIKNRLQKNLKKRQAWTKQANIQAFRLYDKDIPEYPFLVDIYGDYFVVYDKGRKDDEKDHNHLEELIDVLTNDFAKDQNFVIVKSRRRLRNRHGKSEGQKEVVQYQKLDDQKIEIELQESASKFKINLSDYLDTGLFLDHRPLRQMVKKQSQGYKKHFGEAPTFLNLFCYTGAVSVSAALGGALTTNIDMSNTYIKWAEENFELNEIATYEHKFIREDVLKYLTEKPKEQYDFVYCDPPTFSNSKKMEESFEIEREQSFIINACMNRLKGSGTLFFSTNKRDFKLSPQIAEQYRVRDITQQTIPRDFHDQKIHHCFEIRHNQNTDS